MLFFDSFRPVSVSTPCEVTLPACIVDFKCDTANFPFVRVLVGSFG